jgi:hypothetical protein
MLNFSKYFATGLRNTLRALNGINFSYKGPWVQVYPDTVVDEWYVGEFASAEYTISVDYDTFEREIIKCLVVAGPATANVVIYGRSNLGSNLVDLTATVDNSKVSLIASPGVSIDGSTLFIGSKLIFSANYYYTSNELTV